MILLNRFGGKIISRVRKRYFNASETFFNYPLALARDEIHSIARCPKYYRIFTIRSFPSVERFARDRFFFSFLYRCRNRNCQFFPLSPTEHTHTHTRAETVPEVVVVVIVIAVVYYEIRLTPRVYQLPIPTHPPPMPPTRAITSVYIYIRFPHSPNYKSVFFSHLKFTNHITYPHNHCSVQLIIMMYK